MHAHAATVAGFWMDEHPVTVAAFLRFVEDTGYTTVAERHLDPAHDPCADPESLVPGSLGFRPAAEPVDLRDWRKWWSYRPGACWHNPTGRAAIRRLVTTRSSTSPSRTPAYAARRSPRRPSGSAPPAAVSKARSTRGAMKVELAQVQDGVAAQRRPEREFELLEGLARRKPGGLDAGLAAVAVARVDLSLQQGRCEALVGPFFVAGAVGELGQRPGRGRRLEDPEQAREFRRRAGHAISWS